MGGNYTVGGSEVVDHVPLQDGVEVVRDVTFPGSTLQRATDGGNAPTFQTNLTALSALPTGISLARATTATYFDASGVLQTAAIDAARFDHNPASPFVAKGLLIEEQRTNLFLQTGSPANQTITVVNATSYTVSFYGTGSLTLTGAVAHTVTGSSATVLTSYNFTSGTTSLVIAVAGSVVSPNVEAGDFATSHIPTTVAAVTRSADIATLTGTALTTLQGIAGTAFVEIEFPAEESSPPFIGAQAGGQAIPIYYFNFPYQTRTYNGVTVLQTGTTIISVIGINRAGTSWDGAGRSVVTDGGTVASDADATAFASSSDFRLGQAAAIGKSTTGWFRSIAIYSSRLSDATLKATSVVGAPF